MKGFIYKITNKVNGKSYIGQTRYTVEFRWRQHKNKKDDSHFHLAIQKYGADNFTVETLEECEVENLDSREIFYIAKYNTFMEGYNTTIGGGGKRLIFTDNQYDEIKGLYLSGFSSNKIATIYKVDKATIIKTLKGLGVKIRNKSISINRVEFEELVADYKNGYSLRELAKRYDCTAIALKEYMKRRGVEVKDKYNILKDKEAQQQLIEDYLAEDTKLSEIQAKHHCSYSTFCKILSTHGISRGKKHFKLDKDKCLKAVELFKKGYKVPALARKFEVDKSTMYSLLRRYGVDYLTV